MLSRSYRVALLAAALLACAGSVVRGQSPRANRAGEAPVDFAREIRPILSNNCFYCHGPDSEQRKGGVDGLRLDTPDGYRADLGDGRVAVAPGDPAKSELIARITTAHANDRMPPPETGKKLSPREIERLTAWVREGARHAGHWSYQKPHRPEPPPGSDARWSRSPIDRFLFARLEQEGLQPLPEADRATLLRRLSLDLIGLPPSPAELEAFAADQASGAYERQVDRLLARPAFGEHWAGWWLDMARYADSAGYADDRPRVIWRYRDYVIDSLNANKPFDQFTIEQIAGDLLPDPTTEQLIATAFHRNTQTNNEGGTNDEEFRSVAIVDRVNTTMAVWMGATAACAQCHNHKYDPISQEEYFRLFDFFNQSEDEDRGDESPVLSIHGDSQLREKTSLEQELAALEAQGRATTNELTADEQAWDASFPRDVRWRVLHPDAVKAESDALCQVSDDGAILAPSTANQDGYTIEAPLAANDSSDAPAAVARAGVLRLEAMPDDSLPGKGPGQAGGNFVLTRIAADVLPPPDAALRGRYVRIELPGKERHLYLAEVQVFEGAENLATRGAASQSSTDYGGLAELAIDGDTNGHYHEAHSTTHTAKSDDPWWEVDLKSEHAIDRIVVWNRTDGEMWQGTKNFRVTLLDERREIVWRRSNLPAPHPSAELAIADPAPVEFTAALADFSQPKYEAASLLAPIAANRKGWAVGGQIGKPHALMLEIAVRRGYFREHGCE